ALFARRAVDERVVRVQLHGTDACAEQLIQERIVALEATAGLPRIDVLAYAEIAQRDGAAVSAVDQYVRVPKTIGIERLEHVVCAAGDVAHAGAHAQHEDRDA